MFSMLQTVLPNSCGAFLSMDFFKRGSIPRWHAFHVTPVLRVSSKSCNLTPVSTWLSVAPNGHDVLFHVVLDIYSQNFITIICEFQRVGFSLDWLFMNALTICLQTFGSDCIVMHSVVVNFTNKVKGHPTSSTRIVVLEYRLNSSGRDLNPGSDFDWSSFDRFWADDRVEGPTYSRSLIEVCANSRLGFSSRLSNRNTGHVS